MIWFWRVFILIMVMNAQHGHEIINGDIDNLYRYINSQKD